MDLQLKCKTELSVQKSGLGNGFCAVDKQLKHSNGYRSEANSINGSVNERANGDHTPPNGVVSKLTNGFAKKPIKQEQAKENNGVDCFATEINKMCSSQTQTESDENIKINDEHVVATAKQTRDVGSNGAATDKVISQNGAGKRDVTFCNGDSAGKATKSKSGCSKCKRKSVSNVRVQCKMDQYLSAQLNQLKKELSLSLRMPRLPLPSDELSHLRFGRFMKVDEHPNGGGKVLRLYWDEICHLPKLDREALAMEFLKESFREHPHGIAKYVITVVHNAAYQIPDLLEYMAKEHSSLTVKTGLLGHSESDIETTTLSAYREQVGRSYSEGTFRAGPLHQVSLVGVAHEEVGGYFPGKLFTLNNHFEFISQLEVV